MRRRTDLAKRFDHRAVPVVSSAQHERRIYQRYSTMGDKYRNLYQGSGSLVGYDRVGIKQGIYR
jgi:hypothetical protein